MKLTVNKEHNSGKFEKSKSSYIKLVSLAVVASTFTGLVSTAAINAKNLEGIVALNANVRASVYFNNDYLKNTYGLNDDEIFERVNDDSNVDKYITRKALKNITTLNIDRQKNDDLSFLINFPNLRELSVLNASLLTPEDINYINNSNLKNLNLQLNVHDIIKLNSNGFNLNLLNKNNIEISIKDKIKNELDELIIYNFINGNANVRCDNIDIVKCKKLNDNLDNLYNKIDFLNCMSESDKTFQIIKFLLNTLEYDQSLDAYQQTHNTLNPNDEEYQEFYYYNKNMLSSVINQDNDIIEGICCNFAALFSIFCYKAGIENYYVIGEYNSPDILHAWNILNVDGKHKLVDLVKQDVFYYNYDEYQNYELNPSTLNLMELKDKIIEPLNETILNEYIAKADVEELFQSLEEMDYKIYNVSLEGELVNNQKLDMKLPIIISLGSGLIVVLIGKSRKKNEVLSR